MIEYRARIAVVTLAVPLLLIAFTDTVFNRIMSSVGHSGTCLYQLVTEVAPNAEILITGSSRARQSIDPDLVAAMVDLPPHSVVNTAHPSRNLSLDLLMTSHAATGAKLKLVVVELQVGSPSVLKRELELKGRTAQTDPVLRLTSGSYPRDTITTLSFSEAIGLLTQRAASYSLGAYDRVP